MIRAIWLAAQLFMLSLSPALAHKPSDSYLRIEPRGAGMHVQWDISLRDLDFAVGLDQDDDGSLTWGEVRSRGSAISAYALSRLTILNEGILCPLSPAALSIDKHSDGTYAVLQFRAACSHALRSVAIEYSLLFDLDLQHRGLVSYVGAGAVQNAVMAPDHRRVVFVPTGGSPWRAVSEFWRDGIHHILSGADHLVFLAVLLLPAMFHRQHVHWSPVDTFVPAFVEAAKLLTAFTLAHGLTLTLAVLGYITVPGRLSESAIAVTIVLTSLDNIRPFLFGSRWMIAFGFGLIHGIGFANALGPLALPSKALAIALASFNIGIECGQLLVALAILPIGFLLRYWPLYRSAVLPGGSLLATMVALLWLVDRAFALGFMPF